MARQVPGQLRPAPSWGVTALQVLGAIWTSPNTLIGLLAGMAGMAAGAPWGPGGAITLGMVILHTGPDLDGLCLTYAHRAGRCEHPRVRLGDHERAHVYQYMVLGPLFLPVYLACGGVSVRNPFERAADRYAMQGRGWWP